MSALELSRLRFNARRVMLVAQGLVLAAAGILPLLATQNVSAASTQLTTRSVSSTTGVPGAAAQLVFTFTTPDRGAATSVKQIEIEFCDTPLGSCASTSNIPAINASPTVTMGGSWSGAGTTVTRDAVSRNGGADNQITIVYTTPGDENNKTGLTITVPSTTITNNATPNKSYYPRIRLYSDTGTTLEWSGAVAQSTSQTLTVNARVQEVLQFCIGTTTIDDATTQITNNASASVTSCAAADGTSVDLGTVDNGHINATPVPSTSQGDGRLAYAMVQTNAQNGVVIGYRAVQDTSSGKLKVPGASCSGTATTDQCFNSQGGTSGAFTAGTENFGMTIAGINCNNVGTNYGCVYGSATGTNLCLKANYRPTSYTCGTSNTYDTTAGANTTDTNQYAWDDSGATVISIAGSDASTLKVVANEALMIKFAATAQVTTPTGLYQAQADFVATPTY